MPQSATSPGIRIDIVIGTVATALAHVVDIPRRPGARWNSRGSHILARNALAPTSELTAPN
jgi:hypothetical protein